MQHKMFTSANTEQTATTAAKIKPVGLKHIVARMSGNVSDNSMVFDSLMLVFDAESSALAFRDMLYKCNGAVPKILYAPSIRTEVGHIKNENTYFDVDFAVNCKAYFAAIDKPALRGKLLLDSLKKFVDLDGINTIVYHAPSNKVLEDSSAIEPISAEVLMSEAKKARI